jgi:hypothetical protein
MLIYIMVCKRKLYTLDEKFLETFESLVPKGKRSEYIQLAVSKAMGIVKSDDCLDLVDELDLINPNSGIDG